MANARSRVAVVTDSTAYLPESLCKTHEIAVVPVQVVIGGSVSDETDVSAAEVAQALRDWTPVSTSRPTPQSFLSTYEQLVAQGATGIVSVHLSSDMSATIESATLAARGLSVPVAVVDSRSIGMALGFAAVSAAECAAQGGDLEQVVAVAERRAASSSVFFYVDTLEYLRRGGRIGAAAALVGSALSVKPLLQLVDGRVEPFEKVRTTSRALARLEEVAVDRAGDRAVDVAVQHLANAERAETLARRLAERVPGLSELVVNEIGAVVGAHVGPGTISVMVCPRV
ncbi:MAG: DegV family protein [Actinomycetes bacterium]